MVEFGYTYASKNRLYMTLLCGCCGKYLGSHIAIDGMETNDIEEWSYCPYCGRELNNVKEMEVHPYGEE